MSIGVLVLSILFAAIETAASWMMLELPATAAALTGMPLWLITAIVFALGMFLSFILIIVVGSFGITDKAADFVRDNFGRTLVLMLAAVVIIFGLSSGAEALYQMKWTASRMGDSTDLCFVLDFSGSMDSANEDGNGTRIDSLRSAFADVVRNMKDGQRLSIVGFAGEGESTILHDWTVIDNRTREDVINTINRRGANGGTCYEDALMTADSLVGNTDAGRRTAVVMLSDGEDTHFRLSDMGTIVPTILARNVPIYTIGMGDTVGGHLDFSLLEGIATQTGGQFLTSDSNIATFSQNFGVMVKQAGGNGRVTADTLLTAGDPNHKVIFTFDNGRAVLRILLLFLVSFVFKLIVDICIGNNDSHIGVHILTALGVALVGSLVVEFGYFFGLPLLAVEFVFWVLLMGQIVLTNR